MEVSYEPILRERVLAIDPIARGFGFVILEEKPLQLVDWGVRRCRKEDGLACAAALRRMLDRYKPTTVVIEDLRDVRALRAVSLGMFLASVADVLDDATIRVQTYPRRGVRAVFATSGSVTKEAIARTLVQRFPELLPRLPRPRKIWESEDARMSIFDALSLAITHLEMDRTPD